MSRELARKHPAGNLPRTEVIMVSLHERAALMTELNKMIKRKEIGAAYAIRKIESGWAVKVVRIRECPSWLVRNWVKLAVAMTTAVVLISGIIIFLREILTAMAVISLGGIILAMMAKGFGGSRAIEVIQKVTIKG